MLMSTPASSGHCATQSAISFRRDGVSYVRLRLTPLRRLRQWRRFRRKGYPPLPIIEPLAPPTVNEPQVCCASPVAPRLLRCGRKCRQFLDVARVVLDDHGRLGIRRDLLEALE